MDTSVSLPPPNAAFHTLVASQRERCRRITTAVAGRVPGARVKDEDWAWRVTVYGRGSVILRRDTQWISLSTSTGTTFVDDALLGLSEDTLVEKLVELIQAFPHQVPSVTPIVQTLIPLDHPQTMSISLPVSTTPPVQPTPMSDTLCAAAFDVRPATDSMPPPASRGRPRKSAKPRTPNLTRPVTGGVRKSEVMRLKQEGRIFDNYKH